MKNNITVHFILCGLLTGAHMMASDNPIGTVSKSNSREVSPSAQGRSANPSLHPDQEITQTDLLQGLVRLEKGNYFINNLTTIQHFYKQGRDDVKYHLINEQGKRTTEILNKSKQKGITRYQAILGTFEDKFFVKTTHYINAQHGLMTLAEENQSLIEVNLTSAQISAILQNDLPENKKPIFAIDNNRNSYCFNFKSIGDTHPDINDDPSEDETYFSPEQQPFGISPIPSSYTDNCIASITDSKDITYHCYISTENPQLIHMHKQNPKESDLDWIITVEIPKEENKYNSLLQISEKEIVVIDKNQNLYIWDGASTYTPQCKPKEHSMVTIVPLTREERVQEKTRPEISVVKPVHNIKPDTNNKYKINIHKIGGGLTVIAIILAILYKYDQLPSIKELLNIFPGRGTQNFNSPR